VLDGLAEGDAVLRSPAVQPGDRVRPRAVAWDAASATRSAQGVDVGAALTSGMGR